MKGIKIDRLEIRLKGIPQRVAYDSINGLGNELLTRFSKEQGLLKRRGTIRINKIDSGTVQAHGVTNYSGLRGIITNRIAESIFSKIQGNEEEK